MKVRRKEKLLKEKDGGKTGASGVERGGRRRSEE